MRILVVEDYDPVRMALAQALREEGGYTVDEAADGERALAMALDSSYDVLVLDLMLPGKDGLEILRELRDAGRSCHVLILTASDTLDDKIRGLDLGADDYLVKPFAMEEVLARVRALIRRGYEKKSPLIRLGHVEINTNDHSVRVDDKLVELTAREYALLEYMALRAGQVVTRAEVCTHVYGDRSPATSNVVDVYVGYLRKKLELPGKPKLLYTRRGEGYLLVAPE